MTFELTLAQSMCECALNRIGFFTFKLVVYIVLSRLDALDPNAYAAFQASNDLQDVVDRVMNGGGDDGGVAKPGMKKKLSVRANIMTPVKPMLVRLIKACRLPFEQPFNSIQYSVLVASGIAWE